MHLMQTLNNCYKKSKQLGVLNCIISKKVSDEATWIVNVNRFNHGCRRTGKEQTKE